MQKYVKMMNEQGNLSDLPKVQPLNADGTLPAAQQFYMTAGQVDADGNQRLVPLSRSVSKVLLQNG
jgi:hypothetical protein